MRFTPRPGRHRDARVDVTSMIDVIFLLIIFFMTTAQVARFTRAEVDLPRERGEQDTEADETGLVINVTAAGEIIVASRIVDMVELASIVRTELRSDPQQPAQQFKLLLRADRHAPAGRLNRIVELLESLGVGQARLATEVPG